MRSSLSESWLRGRNGVELEIPLLVVSSVAVPLVNSLVVGGVNALVIGVDDLEEISIDGGNSEVLSVGAITKLLWPPLPFTKT